MRIYQSGVLPGEGGYAAETSWMTRKEEKLKKLERKVIRRIYGLKKVEED